MEASLRIKFIGVILGSMRVPERFQRFRGYFFVPGWLSFISINDGLFKWYTVTIVIIILSKLL